MIICCQFLIPSPSLFIDPSHSPLDILPDIKFSPTNIPFFSIGKLEGELMDFKQALGVLYNDMQVG